MIFIIFNPFSQVARVVWSAHDEHVGRSASGAFPRSSLQPSVILTDCSFLIINQYSTLLYWLESERMRRFSNWNWMLASSLFFSFFFVSVLAWGSWILSSLMIVRVALQVMANHSVKGYSELYASPEDIDLWTAGISERPLPGSMVSLFNNRSY